MKITSKELFTIVATAKFEMDKHPEDFKKTLPKVNEILKRLITEWEYEDELVIYNIPF